MTKHFKYPRVISRRDTLKACIVPATAALTGRFLSGCSAAGSGSDMLTDTSGAPATQTSAAASSGKSTSTTMTTTTTMTAANSSSAAGGAPVKSAAGSSAASSVNGAAGTTAAPSGNTAAMGTSGSGALAQAGSPAGGGSPAAAAAGASSQAGAGGAAGAAASGSTVTGMADASVMWATGGTAKMAKSYEDPFQKSPGTSCKLYPSQTLGPCYAEKPMMRSDISDGLDGLPVRLSFLVVDKNCKPVPNATVDIWHSGSQGIYSAYAMGTTCNPGSDNVLMKTFCRGVQPLDETGRANFSTVFPGWYMGRTIHIHFTLRVGGKESVTSQLYFEDALVDEILAQGQYKARGKRDTTNTRDGIFSSGNATPDEVIMEHVKRPDGVLHAWKVLSIG